MPYLFRTPTYKERPHFLGTWGMSTGVTVVRNGAVFHDVIVPRQEFLDSCDGYWRGGYDHIVDDVTGAALEAAGYDAELIPTAYGFGLGPFGEAPFGGNA